MSYTIGSARIDENGNTKGGAAGDQTGKEVSTQAFYVHKKGWIVLRWKDPIKAMKAAKAMLAACDNNNIGYDQGNRNALLSLVKKNNITDLSKVSSKTECDCSGLVRVCVYLANGNQDPGAFTTLNEVSVLLATGLFERIVYTSGMPLQTGDILVTKTKGHTVIVVKGETVFAYKVLCTALNIRKEPSMDAKVLTTVHKADLLTIAEISGTWGKTTANGKEGWVSLANSKYIVKT